MLRKKYTNKADIPADVLSHYQERNGEWALTIEDDSSDDPNSRITEFRENNLNLTRQLQETRSELTRVKDRFKDIDPEQVRKSQEAIRKVEAEEERKLLSEGKFDEVLTRRTAALASAKDEEITAHKRLIKETQDERETIRAKLGKHLISEGVQQEIAKQGLRLRPNAITDALFRANNVYRINSKGDPEPIGSDGKLLYGKDGNLLGYAEFVKTKLVVEAPHLFDSASGGNSEGSETPTRGKGGRITIKRDDMVAKGKHLKEIAKGEVDFID